MYTYMPAAAKYSLDGGCVKSILPPAAAKFYFERHIIFEISRSEISKMMCLSSRGCVKGFLRRFAPNYVLRDTSFSRFLEAKSCK